MTDYRPLLDIVVAHVGMPMPDGCDAWGMRAVHPDLRSSREGANLEGANLWGAILGGWQVGEDGFARRVAS